MTKYARIVIETKVKDDISEEELTDVMEPIIADFFTSWNSDDVEISNPPYTKENKNERKSKQFK